MSIKDNFPATKTDPRLVEQYAQKHLTKTKARIADQMSNTLRIVYLFNMLTSFIITLFIGFNFYGFKLDPMTYIVYMISSITFASITTLITKLLNNK